MVKEFLKLTTDIEVKDIGKLNHKHTERHRETVTATHRQTNTE